MNKALWQYALMAGAVTMLFGVAALTSTRAEEIALAEDGTVNSAHQAVLLQRSLTATMNRLFDYGESPRPDLEAEVMAFEHTKTLLASTPVYDRIKRDMAMLESRESRLLGFDYRGWYAEGQLIVRLRREVRQDGLHALNHYYQGRMGAVFMSTADEDWRVIAFPACINMDVMAETYAQLPEVAGAQPDYIAGLSDFASVTARPTRDGELMIYELERGYEDCFSGCACREYSTYAVSPDGSIELLDFHEAGSYSCAFISPPWGN